MAEEAVAEEAKGKKNPLILFIIIAVLLVAASVGGTLFFLGGTGGNEADEVVEDVTPEAIYYALNPKFKTNYDVNGRPRLFQVAITLVTREQDVIKGLSQHAPTIKGKLVILLSGQKFDDLQTPEGRESLRQQCLDAVQQIMNTEIGKPGVEQVLFTDFVMQ